VCRAYPPTEGSNPSLSATFQARVTAGRVDCQLDDSGREGEDVGSTDRQDCRSGRRSRPKGEGQDGPSQSLSLRHLFTHCATRIAASMVALVGPRDDKPKTPPGPEGSNGIGRFGCRGKPARAATHFNQLSAKSRLLLDDASRGDGLGFVLCESIRLARQQRYWRDSGAGASRQGLPPSDPVNAIRGVGASLLASSSEKEAEARQRAGSYTGMRMARKHCRFRDPALCDSPCGRGENPDAFRPRGDTT
jgi:hypothetical protein